LSAKFTKDSNFFVLEVGRGSGVLVKKTVKIVFVGTWSNFH